MSSFSGKCDVYDTLIEIHKLNDATDWSKIRIFQYNDNNNPILLNIKSVKDLIPYSAHLTASYAASNGSMTVFITNKSFVDIENEERINYCFKLAKKEYKKLKRKKVDFDEKTLCENISFMKSYSDVNKKVCERVFEHPYAKNDISDIYEPIYNYYKDSLIKEMLKFGYTKEEASSWCYKGIKLWE